jgi:hypothetical protein
VLGFIPSRAETTVLARGSPDMELVNLITAGGPYALAAVMGFLYWTERSERKEWQDRYAKLQEEMTERLINAINSASQVTRDMTTAMQTLNATFQNVMFRLRGIDEQH